MKVPITHHSWQLLRKLVRAGKPLPGRELRMEMSRRTKDGSFLTRLVEFGLLEVVSLLPVAETDKKYPPAQEFRTVYRLTDAGKHAAEHGLAEVTRDKQGSQI